MNIERFSKIDLKKISDVELVKAIRECLDSRNLKDAYQVMKIIRSIQNGQPS